MIVQAALILSSLALLVTGANTANTGIRGHYLEARTCDVYTGPCFANAEVGAAGHEATLAWKVEAGSLGGVDLSGLCVVAVVVASNTLGDPHREPYPTRTVLLLDETASEDQRAALREFALFRLGKLAGCVAEERVLPIELELKACGKSGCGKLVAGDVCKIETRCLGGDDHVCGNEEVFYPPLTVVDRHTPAYTIEHSFRSKILGTRWVDRGSRSAFTASFSAPAAILTSRR